jgi:hypothetical protein
MFWWNISALKDLLVRGPLPQPMAIRYLTVFVACSCLATFPGSTPGDWDLVNFASNVGIGLIGTVASYFRNGGAGGAHLLDRYLSLGFVVVLRLFPLMFLVSYLAHRVQCVPMSLHHPVSLAEVLAGSGSMTFYYWRLCVHIHAVRMRSVEAAVGQG